MLEDRSEHNMLAGIAALASVLGAILLTGGMFMYYGCDDYHNVTFFVTSGGGLLLLAGMGVGNYTKWRCQR